MAQRTGGRSRGERLRIWRRAVVQRGRRRRVGGLHRQCTRGRAWLAHGLAEANVEEGRIGTHQRLARTRIVFHLELHPRDWLAGSQQRLDHLVDHLEVCGVVAKRQV